MLITESNLRKIIRSTVVGCLTEAFDNAEDGELEIIDDWYSDDSAEFGDAAPEGPTAQDLANQDLEDIEIEKPTESDKVVKDKKKAMVDRLLQQIYAKQGKNPANIDDARTGNYSGHGTNHYDDTFDLDF